MMHDSSSRNQAYECFIAEAPELLKTIELDLLTLQEDRSSNKVYSLMRATHTLKGMVASVGLETIEKVAHSLEDIFNAFYDPAVVIDAELEALLFRGYECLRLLLTAEFTQIPIEQAEISAQADAVFAQLQAKLGPLLGRTKHLPTSTELRFDITQSIFESVVKEGLATLANALKQPTTEKVAIALQEKASVFLGLAEGLNLPGFAAIAQTTIAALEAHPDQATTIARIALADFQKGQALILAGDRDRGGEPSTTLKQLVQIQNQSTATHFSNQTLMEREQTDVTGQSETDQPVVSSPQTIRIDLERLNRLKYLTGNLLVNQNRQDSAKEQLEDTLQKFRENFQRHQQTLHKIREALHKIRDRPKASPDLFTEASLNSPKKETEGDLTPLMQSALEESEQFEETLGQVAFVHQQLSQALEKQQQLVTTLQDGLTEAQMAPLEEVFNRLLPVLQRLVVVYGKPAELKLSGAQVLVDKAIAEKLYEPLLHLVRNAFDHGLESRITRKQQGKPETGQIHILAYPQGGQLVIEVQDDGRGLDFDKIREKMVQMNLLLPTETLDLPDSQLLDLLFEPGFSTASQIDELSGRGIGLDVVRSQLQALQGSITVRSVPLRGTTFVLQIPLPVTVIENRMAIAPAEQSYIVDLEAPSKAASLTPSLEEVWGNAPISEDTEITFPISESTSTEVAASSPFLPELSLKTTQLFIWLADSMVFALPYSMIEEHLTPKADQKIQFQNQWFLHWRDDMIRVYQMSELLSNHDLFPQSATRRVNQGALLTLVIRQEQQFVALESNISSLVTESELVVQSSGYSDSSPDYLHGYTFLEDDRWLPVIDVATLLNQATGGPGRTITPTASSRQLPQLQIGERFIAPQSFDRIHDRDQ